jgi:hypothetical protein
MNSLATLGKWSADVENEGGLVLSR